ncbi:hypothetical protein H312_02947, partial [Anncaliia algerae PRA339]
MFLLYKILEYLIKKLSLILIFFLDKNYDFDEKFFYR